MDTVDTHDAESIAVNLCEDLKKLREEFTRDARNFAHIGFTMWKHGSKPAELLAEADHALRTASSGEAIDWNRYQADTQAESSIRGKEYARSRALEAVKTGNIRLCTQPVHPNGNAANPVQNEITVRLPDGHGGYTAEGVYHPLIDSMDCAGKLDRLVIEKFLAYMKQDNSQVPCTINLSTTSVTNPDFGSWLLGTLDTSGVKASRIQLEMMENTVVNHIDQARELINRLADAGYRSGIDHFGKDFHPFGYLSTLRISYIKIDGYYTRSINSNRDNQFFVKALKDTVHTLGIDVIAQSIETTAEHETLRSIKLDGYQGYVFGKPDPI
jgi:EAL domain-containing protein (putative c-di-GMP-specific phosphodiesterase class I)